jgi:L-alanine-DL-glutamate epimerase-like enolase superfamily enzyme
MRVRRTELFLIELAARMPFKYGIASLESVPHLILRSAIEIGAAIHHGFAAENLPPKWFTKDPATSYEDDLSDMLSVIRQACLLAEEAGPHPTPFALWRTIYDAQSAWARGKHPPLLAGLGVSLIERAMIDAFCRATGQTFHRAVHTNSLGINLADLHPELAGARPSDFLPANPLDRIIVRHTVGLADPLTDTDVSQRLDDQLPQTLEQSIRAYGLSHFKLKLGGDVDADLSRLRAIARVLDASCPDYHFTLDANENYRALEPFQHLVSALADDPALARCRSGLLFIEQPLHRDVALADQSRQVLLDWTGRPPLIIDESDATFDALPRALDSGYIGASHKNCKGVYKGLASGCLIAQRNRTDRSNRYTLSAEDLTTVGPVALLQDLAVIATLGIPHAERNGHHYFAGLRGFPASVQAQVLSHHPDLYHLHGGTGGFPTLTIQSGALSTTSVNAAPFGINFIPDLGEVAPVPKSN